MSSAAARAASSMSAAPTATAQPFRHVPTQAVCRRVLGSACYAADAVRRAYGVDKLDAAGITGKGRTVVVWEEVVPDTLRADLETFSTTMKLPLPDLTVDRYAPAGHIAPFDAQNARMAGAALETTLDTQMVHMLAPDAKIVVTQIGLPEHAYASPSPGTPTTPSAQDARRAAAVGAALILDGIAQSVRNHRPDAISISYGIEEYTAAGDSQAPAEGLLAFSPALAEVVASGTTLTASTGDFGAAPPVGPGRERVRSVSWPASDPSVLALGGSRLHLDAEGRRTGPDTVWHDRAGATGGGPSNLRPPPLPGPGGGRGGRAPRYPDISMDGSASGGTLVYQGFLPAGAGWLPVGGTSEAAPMFAALVALANQEAGRRLGALHEALYALAGDPHGGVVDITEGDNGPYGFQAGPGYDLASGLGTVDASVLVPQLAARVRPRR
ncbi:S53 family peptidase [Streptomyces albulus]|nr:S53 family peptidase [Streptomyces noursei]